MGGIRKAAPIPVILIRHSRIVWMRAVPRAVDGAEKHLEVTMSGAVRIVRPDHPPGWRQAIEVAPPGVDQSQLCSGGSRSNHFALIGSAGDRRNHRPGLAVEGSGQANYLTSQPGKVRADSRDRAPVGCNGDGS